MLEHSVTPGFAVWSKLAHLQPASYPLPVRQPAVLPPASFREGVTAVPVAFGLGLRAFTPEDSHLPSTPMLGALQPEVLIFR